MKERLSQRRVLIGKSYQTLYKKVRRKIYKCIYVYIRHTFDVYVIKCIGIHNKTLHEISKSVYRLSTNILLCM